MANYRVAGNQGIIAGMQYLPPVDPNYCAPLFPWLATDTTMMRLLLQPPGALGEPTRDELQQLHPDGLGSLGPCEQSQQYFN